MIRRPPRSTQSRSSAASDVYKRQLWLCLLGRGGQVVAGVGGPQTVLNSPTQLSCQGLSLGRWMTSRRADLARRPGTAISCRRMVAVVALAWNTDAMVPAARVRLNAIAANTSQAPLAANWPEGACCLLYTSDAADDLLCVDPGGRRI